MDHSFCCGTGAAGRSSLYSQVHACHSHTSFIVDFLSLFVRASDRMDVDFLYIRISLLTGKIKCQEMPPEKANVVGKKIQPEMIA